VLLIVAVFYDEIKVHINSNLGPILHRLISIDW